MAGMDELTTAATEGDPRTGLRAVRALRRLVEQLEASQVALAREQGWSWHLTWLTLSGPRSVPGCDLRVW